ncbi:MAG: hypothetical protein ACO3LE_02905 [Bdellovibrionota bacterium]
MLRALCNEILFGIRRLGPRWRWQAYSESLELSFEQDFFEQSLAKRLRSESLALNCFYLSLFNSNREHLRSGPGLWLDVGALDFRYAPALAKFAQNLGVSSLRALEADTKRLYQDFFRRRDYAEYFGSLAQKHFGLTVSYERANFLNWKTTEKIVGISCLFPFLFQDLHDGFGLPVSYYSPERFYEHLMRMSSQVLFFHQGKLELDESMRLIQNLVGSGARMITGGPYQETPWLNRKNPVYTLVWKTKD